MPEIVATTHPTPDGEMLWCVKIESSYYDNDPRMPGTVPIAGRFYVLATSRDEAISKADPSIAQASERADPGALEKVEATIVTIESLIPARDSSDDGRIGWVSTRNLSPVTLTNPDDAKRYRLGVCLVPIE